MNKQDFSYQHYVTDEKFLADYNAYQAKYAGQMRESDKVIVDLIRQASAARVDREKRLRVLDIGCSTGNLLLHIKRLLPDLALFGGDLAVSSLEQCRHNPELAGIDFHQMNLLDLPQSVCDIAIVNAVLYMMEDEQFARSLRSLSQCLSAEGHLIVFDFFHPFDQHLSIMERSRSHPDGLRLVFRPMADVARLLREAGFAEPQYRPFFLPIDLPRRDDGELVTYTVTTEDDLRIPYRGALSQPWCHMITRKL